MNLTALTCPNCGSHDLTQRQWNEYGCRACGGTLQLKSGQTGLELVGRVCPHCGFHNAADARFCGRCGQKMVRHCAECGSDVGLHTPFCQQCGAHADRAAAEVEQVAAHRPLRAWWLAFEEHGWGRFAAVQQLMANAYPVVTLPAGEVAVFAVDSAPVRLGGAHAPWQGRALLATDRRLVVLRRSGLLTSARQQWDGAYTEFDAVRAGDERAVEVDAGGQHLAIETPNPARQAELLAFLRERQQPAVGCPACGQMAPARHRHCMNCGASLQDATLPAAPAMPDSAPLPVAAAVLPAPRPWYRSTLFYLGLFIFFMPIWTFVILTDTRQPAWLKLLAGILLGFFVILFIGALELQG